MGRSSNQEEEKVMGFILAVIMAVAIAIIKSRQWFPYFLVGSVIFLVGFIIVGAIELFFRDHSYLSFWNYISVYVGAALIICFVGTGLTYAIGYGLGGTSFGQASLDFYYGVTGAEQELENSINQLVEDSCKDLPEESCEMLRTTAKTAKTLQEVSDLADKLDSSYGVIEQSIS